MSSQLLEDMRRWLRNEFVADMWSVARPRRAAVVWFAPRDRRRMRTCMGCGHRVHVLVERGRLKACPDCATGMVSSLLARLGSL